MSVCFDFIECSLAIIVYIYALKNNRIWLWSKSISYHMRMLLSGNPSFSIPPHPSISFTNAFRYPIFFAFENADCLIT